MYIWNVENVEDVVAFFFDMTNEIRIETVRISFDERMSNGAMKYFWDKFTNAITQKMFQNDVSCIV